MSFNTKSGNIKELKYTINDNFALAQKVYTPIQKNYKFFYKIY